MLPIGFVAVLAGWVTTEAGRQPWVVYGLMRTADAVTPSLTGGAGATSLAAFVIVYALIFPAGVYYMVRLVQRGPQPSEDGGEPSMARRRAAGASALGVRRAARRAGGVIGMSELGTI